MAQTKAQIRDRAAQELGILRLEQQLQSQDATRIEQGYTEVYEQLKEAGIAFWAYSGSVPDKFAFWVIAMVAYNCLGTYGVSPERYNRVLFNAGDGGEKAMQKIRQIGAEHYKSQDDAKDY